MKINGLLGKKLSHSFSPAVHRAFGTPKYRLYETDDVASFLKNEQFFAVNVTIPYKETVLPFLDEIDEIAQRTGSVNLILRTETGLMGYNTDYDGMAQMFRHYGVSLVGKSVLILGNGGAARTLETLAKDSGCRKVLKVARHPRLGELPFSEIEQVADCEIIVHATPVGMFPNNDGILPVDPAVFRHPEAFFDLIYNPLHTRLMIAFQSRGIPSHDGLYLLVAQAKRTHEIISGKSIAEAQVETIFTHLKKQALNLVLVGLPLSGKSAYCAALAERFQKIPVDTDAMIEAECQMPITDIFRINGEAYFRQRETDAVDRIYRLGNQVIATGGGMIENPEVMAKLKQNGVILFLDKDPREIAKLKIENRPLIQTADDVLRLSKRRDPLYRQYADILIDANRPLEDNLEEIEERIHEYLGHQRP